MIKKSKKTCTAINCLQKLLILVLAINKCVLICAFASLTVTPIGTANSAVALKICEIAVAIKNRKSATNKKTKNCIIG